MAGENVSDDRDSSEHSEGRDFVQSLERGLAVLRAFDQIGRSHV